MHTVLNYEVSELDKRLLSGVRSARVGIREGLLIEFLQSGRDIARIELPTEKEAGTLYNSLRVAALRKSHPVRLVRRHTMVFLVRTLEVQSPKKIAARAHRALSLAMRGAMMENRLRAFARNFKDAE